MRFQPVRKISRSNWSVTGRVVSVKTAQLHSFESLLERDYLTLLEFDPKVDYFTEQPVSINYKFEGKVRKYTPDFFVSYHPELNLKPLLVEIKYLADFKKNALLYFPKFQAAKQYCQNMGWQFVTLSEADIRTVFLNNLKFLKRYLFAKDISQSDSQLILDYLSKTSSTPEKLIEQCAFSVQRKAELLFVLWHLVATGELSCNLQSPLLMSSEIWKTHYSR